MNLNEILKKRLKGMTVRILACVEHTLSCHLDDMADNDQFILTGADLKLIRSEILNAGGDTTRSLTDLFKDQPIGKTSLSREAISAINKAELGFTDDEEPFCIINGDFDILNRLREQFNQGVVYNNKYICVGMDSVVNFAIPFFDKINLAGIKISDGQYQTWRDEVCSAYLGGLANE